MAGPNHKFAYDLIPEVNLRHNRCLSDAGDERFRLAVVHDVRDLAGGEKAVDGREIQPRTHGCPGNFHKPDLVFHEQRDVVPALQPGTTKEVSKAIRASVEIGPAQGLAARSHDYRRCVRLGLGMNSGVHGADANAWSIDAPLCLVRSVWGGWVARGWTGQPHSSTAIPYNRTTR